MYTTLLFSFFIGGFEGKEATFNSEGPEKYFC